MDKKFYTIILAGGRGERMGAKIPKQFIEIEGKPILRHTIERFLSLDADMEIIVVLPENEKEKWIAYCEESGFLQRYIIVSGGITRFHSVQNALKYVPKGTIVAVHDGVRPCLDKEFLRGLYKQTADAQALIPVLSPVESVREIEPDGTSIPVDRSKYVLVQTPQLFHSEVLLDAYSQAYSPKFTDDASVVEAAGYKVKLCDGSRGNIKITTPADLIAAGAILRQLR
ncbi:MAG: 2-C-methyl-D-erythritol 4-phosphate cytidylyltransferase [Bacteroidales bacterium]|jgi:2-C-methyl-D-erythritol 4-phosphate cytidylyltransferase|nr:2-C-methyl-D-erythritol 4-phosphate cytidylyltransferase [Bacteroidales bacterium]MDD3200702.1 2-C-methyl-D-erythritol 4-phosphate cytidylyltransferase [Bacteroidales bacterium]